MNMPLIALASGAVRQRILSGQLRRQAVLNKLHALGRTGPGEDRHLV